MQFDSHTQSSRPESFLVPFNSGPVAPLQNHALAPGEEILGKNPQLMFETHSEIVIPQIGAQLSRPPVLVQPDGGIFGRELTSECRLARGWKPTIRRTASMTSPCTISNMRRPTRVLPGLRVPLAGPCRRVGRVHVREVPAIFGPRADRGHSLH